MGGVSDLKPTKLKPVIVFFKGHYQNKEFYIFKKIKRIQEQRQESIFVSKQKLMDGSLIWVEIIDDQQIASKIGK